VFRRGTRREDRAAEHLAEVLDRDPQIGDAMPGRQAERIVGGIQNRLCHRHPGVDGFGDDGHTAPGEPFVDGYRHRGPEIGDVAFPNRVEIAPVQQTVRDSPAEGKVPDNAGHPLAYGKPRRHLTVKAGGDEIGAVARCDRGGEDRPAGATHAHRLAGIAHERANRPGGMNPDRGGRLRLFRQDELARCSHGHGRATFR